MGKILEQMKRESPPSGEKTLSLEEGVAAEARKKDGLARAYLLKGKKFFIEGDYEGSLREYQKAVSLLQKTPPADEAVFMMGLILAYAENPKKDANKSIGFMKRLVKEYPQSFFVLPAKSWIGILQANEKLAADNEKLMKDYEKLTKILEEYKQVDIEIEEKKKEKER